MDHRETSSRSSSTSSGSFTSFAPRVQKKALAHDIKQAMKAKGISPSEMARRMRTSREAVYRLLDPTRTGVTLDSLQRAASALGLSLNISFEAPARRSAARPRGLAGRRKKRAA